MSPRRSRWTLGAILAAGLASGCAAHERQVRAFEEGRETTFWREQVARAGSIAAAPALRAEVDPEAVPPGDDLGDRWVRRAEERDDFEGILDLSAPPIRAAFEAGASTAGMETLLAAGPPSLDALRALVAARSPAVRSARESWRATVEQIDQARWLEEVTASFRSFARDLETRVGGGAGGPRSMTAEFHPWPAATALRGEMADLEASMARERARMALVAALADAEDAYASSWESTERARVLEGFLPALRNMAGVAASRYGAGRGSQDEALRVEVEIRWMESDLAGARERRTEAVARLNSLLDRSPAAPMGILSLPVVPGVPPAREVLIAAIHSSPEVAMAERALDLSRVAVRMAEVMTHPLPTSAAVPDARPGFGSLDAPAGGAGMGMEGGRTGMGGSAMTADGAPPWYGVEEAYIRELRRRAEAAGSARDAAMRGAEAMAAEAWRMYDAALRDLRVARDTAVPLAGQAFEVSRRDYQTGAATFADHLEAWGALVRARLEEVRMRRMAVEARAQTLRATARRIGE